MTREEIISGLKFTIDMFMFDPSTGETLTEPRNDMDKTTIESCKGAIKELQDNSYELWKESYEVEHERNIRLEEKIKALEQEPCEDAVSRKAVINQIFYSTDNSGDVVLGSALRKRIARLPSVAPQEPKTEKCKWIRYDYRTLCPQNHDVNNPYWRIPENRMDALKYCPYCGKEIEVEK